MLASALGFVKRLGYLMTSQDGLVRKRIGNNIMYLDLKDAGLSAQLMEMKPGSPGREPAFMKILRQEIREGMTALDIGANIGYVTLIMAEIVGPSGKVYAFEPEPRNFKILTKNIEANGYSSLVFPYQMGISNINGVLKFHVSNKSNLGSMVVSKHSKYAIDVPVSTLDNFMRDKGCPGFIKMDIEGHEVEALEGMYNTLKNYQSPVKILIEVHPMYYSEDHDLGKQLRRLIDIGFNTKYVVSAGVAKPDFFTRHGYEPAEIFHTGNWSRGIYTNISNEHMLMAACQKHIQFIKHKKLYTDKIVRAIMMEK
jgi:FkbM family methyltransferase